VATPRRRKRHSKKSVNALATVFLLVGSCYQVFRVDCADNPLEAPHSAIIAKFLPEELSSSADIHRKKDKKLARPLPPKRPRALRRNLPAFFSAMACECASRCAPWNTQATAPCRGASGARSSAE
jgi:hypothetical protein